MSIDQRNSAEFEITGMSCGHCEAAVREEVSTVVGVEEVKVNAETGRLVVIGESLDDAAVVAAVDEAGYAAEKRAES